MPKPVCVPCQRFFRCICTGFYFIEGMPTVSGALPGTQQPEGWVPYKLWAGDKYKCEGCGTEIISGFGAGPVVEHYEKDFAEMVQITNARYQVNDC